MRRCNVSIPCISRNADKGARVEIEGIYLVPGADMRTQGQQKDWMVLGAIVVGPKGPVFFKMTGPAAAVRHAAADFDGMLSTLSPH